MINLFLAGDVMTGRGIDQVLPHPGDARIYESCAKSACDYVALAERVNGPIARPLAFGDIWGDALTELERRRPDARIVNLETAVTQSPEPEPKGVNYKMNPANVGAITEAGIECCVLANNHVLDWGCSGLIETLTTLEQAGVHLAGAGRDQASAAAPAIIPVGTARVLVYALASPTSGVPATWAAGAHKLGVNLLPSLSETCAQVIAEEIHGTKRPGDIVVVSIHWGPNWGYAVPDQQVGFAHRLIDSGAADVIHGHSSHHVKGIEVYRQKLILYGCGDFINDYEGISDHEEFRDDLVLMCFPTVRCADGTLADLNIVPLQIRNMRLHRISLASTRWLADTLNREGKGLGNGITIGPDQVLRLVRVEARETRPPRRVE
ncbi:MAG: CapA family protein [Hyphomicrobiaceae bacterium]|nr:CapA family protein [Hyphomicrobiaceae bacterium]